MPVSPANILSLPLAHLRTLIAACPAFQAWTGAANAAAAAARIHLVNLPEGDLTRPFALIGYGEKWKYTKIADISFQARGELFVMFEDDVASANQASEADAVIAFMNDVGATLAEMMDFSGWNGYLHIAEIEIGSVPERFTSEEGQMDEDYYRVEFVATWDGR
jgi:hypothetical protein